jgi:hypothetical protein
LGGATVTGSIVGGMVDLREESFDFISTGWLRYLPERRSMRTAGSG